jgi:uncharacterized protein (TIGR01244 family)
VIERANPPTPASPVAQIHHANQDDSMQKTLIALGVFLALTTASCSTTSDAVVEPEHTAITTESLELYECGDITRLHTFGGIFVASQPTPEDFAQSKMGGVRTVINLRHEAENKDFNEREVIEGLELNYVSLPWNGPEELNDGIFDELRNLLNTAERPILLHCSSANRVGALWLPWRVLDGGIDLDAALAEAKTVGLKSPVYEAMAIDYIERH